MLQQAQGQLKKGIFILFFISLAFDFYPRWKGTDDSIPVNKVDENITHERQFQEQPTQNQDIPGYEQNFGASSHEGQPHEASERRPKSDAFHNLHISYCVSCSYKSQYQRIVEHVNIHYPNIIVDGSEYPAPPMKQLLGKAFTFFQYGLFAIMMFGDHIFKAMNITPRAIYHKLKEKKMMVFLFVYFMGGNVQSMLTSTGAFEISLDGNLIFSKLQSGIMPGVDKIDALLDQYA